MTAMAGGYPYIVNPEVVGRPFQLNGKPAVECAAQIYGRKLTRLNINGPQGSAFDLYKNYVSDQTRIDSTTRGVRNTADYSGGPLYVGAGDKLIGVWSVAGTGQSATFYFNPGDS